jgi:hypothetical protein
MWSNTARALRDGGGPSAREGNAIGARSFSISINTV